jgi:hypothetical protein
MKNENEIKKKRIQKMLLLIFSLAFLIFNHVFGTKILADEVCRWLLTKKRHIDFKSSKKKSREKAREKATHRIYKLTR